MTAPVTMLEASARGLLAANGIPIFDSEDAWDAWAEPNCYSCPFFAPTMDDPQACALRPAVLFAMVSPELAGIFGFAHAFVHAAPDGSYEARDFWAAPDRCHFKPFDTDGDDDAGDDEPTTIIPGDDGFEVVGVKTLVVRRGAVDAFRAMQRPPAEPFTVAG